MSDVWTPPQAPLESPSTGDRVYASKVRQHHLNHESALKSVGLLYYFFAGVLLVAAPATELINLTPFGRIIAPAILAGLGLVLFWVGRGLQRLERWAKAPAGILSSLGLLGFPVWTMVNGYILYLLFSAKGTMVFSEEYRQVITDTPDMTSRSSLVAWIALGLLAALAIGIIVLVT